MKSPVLRLLRFVHGLRDDFFEAAATLGWKEFTRDQGVSMGSYRNVFLHLASVEEQHVSKFCEGIAAPWPSWSSEVSPRRHRDIESVRRRLAQVTALADERMPRWDSPRELARRVPWVRRGTPLRISREAALTQCVTEHLLHLGEVEAMLWQRNVAPPTTLWIDREVLHGRPPAPPPVPVMRRVLRERESRSRAMTARGQLPPRRGRATGVRSRARRKYGGSRSPTS